MFAAAGMLLATGEARFRDDFDQGYVELDYDPSYLHLNGFAAQLYLRSAAGDPKRKRAILEWLRVHADRAREDGDKHPFQLAARFHWGMIGAGFTRTGSYNVKRCLQDPEGASRDCEQALANVHYTLGRNYLQTCYVSGLPGVTRARTWAVPPLAGHAARQAVLLPGHGGGGTEGQPGGDG